MALKTRIPPFVARELLKDALTRATGPLGGATRALAGGPAEELDAPDPLPVFVVTPEQILEGSYIEEASLEGWSYTVFRADAPIGGAELAQTAEGEELHFSHFSEGPFVEAAVQAIAQAEALSLELDRDFEPRLFRCPSLYLMAVWLHSEPQDVFIPMAPVHQLFTPYKVYEKAEFDELLIQAAKESLVFGAKVNPKS